MYNCHFAVSLLCQTYLAPSSAFLPLSFARVPPENHSQPRKTPMSPRSSRQCTQMCNNRPLALERLHAPLARHRATGGHYFNTALFTLCHHLARDPQRAAPQSPCGIQTDRAPSPEDLQLPSCFSQMGGGRGQCTHIPYYAVRPFS